MSAIVSPDSPFQTPLAPLIARLLPTTLWMKCKIFFSWVTKPTRQFTKHIYSACVPYFQKPHHILPSFSKHRSPYNTTEPASFLFETPFPDASPEVPAILWVLETSTDPHMISAAAEISYDLQWSCANITLQQTRLYESFLACFQYSEVFQHIEGHVESRFLLDRVRDGMSLAALHIGRACWALQDTHDLKPQIIISAYLIEETEPELANLLKIVNKQPDLISNCSELSAIKWALHIIPSLKYENLEIKQTAFKYFLNQFKDTTPDLDPSSFADYLCCINNFLSTMSRCDMLRMDKSQFQGQLFENILKTLVSRLKNDEISLETSADIVETTGRLASKSGTMEASSWSGNLYYYSNRLDIVYQFCSSLPQLDGWISIVLAAGLLTQCHETLWYHHNSSNGDPGWVYKALNNVDVSTEGHDQWDSKMEAGVSGLLQALHYYGVPPLKGHLPILLQALSIPGDISRNAAYLLMQKNIVDWFQDHELQPILQASSVWSSLAGVSIDVGSDSFCQDFICLGHILANDPDWHSHIYKELCCWIAVFFECGLWDLAEQYNSVLSTIWNLDTGDYEFANTNEKAVALSFIALSNNWEDFDFGTSDSLKQVVSWLHCTASHFAVLREEYSYNDKPLKLTPQFQTIFSLPLHNALMHAAKAAKTTKGGLQETSPEQTAVLDSIAHILEDIAGQMPKPTDAEKGWMHWLTLRDRFEEDITQLEESIRDLSE
ncbi:hypothetical protein C8R44DRAFT_805896 [Mycena epipterygia]|nr:hypothetical protein C8R44DRAFT_805896 [Mycena epipterygia]